MTSPFRASYEANKYSEKRHELDLRADLDFRVWMIVCAMVAVLVILSLKLTYKVSWDATLEREDNRVFLTLPVKKVQSLSKIEFPDSLNLAAITAPKELQIQSCKNAKFCISVNKETIQKEGLVLFERQDKINILLTYNYF